MRRILASVLLASSASAVDNGIGMLPPMGWRSWNCYAGHIDQDKMELAMDKIAARTRMVDGTLTSLKDVGFVNVGLDDNWQACHTGINGSFHDAEGRPLINETKFPDMGGMVKHGHSLDLRVGWYTNNCLCRESTAFASEPEQYMGMHMRASAAAVAEYGFDGVKLDHCAPFMNLTWWAQLLNETGRPIMIENCHSGIDVPGQTTGNGPCAGDAGVSDCPYNFYRTSIDIESTYANMISNLLSTRPFQGSPPLSRPGSWAYPDMLEVGNLASYEEDRAHFAAWCIVSSPLILSFDLANETLTDSVWPIITNKEVLEVSQTWAGHPGRLVKSYDPTGGSANESMMVWGKVLGAHDQAALIISNYEGTVNYTVEVDLTEFGFAAGDSVKVRDLYAKKDIMTAKGSFQTEAVASHDSRMYRFTQVTDDVDLQEVEA